MPNSSPRSPPLSRHAWAIAAAGLAAAAIEMAFVLPIQQFLLGNPPARIFAVIAAGALGRPALRGGANVVALGAAIHVFVSLGAAAVSICAARLWDDVLLRRPVVSGMAFGIVCYVVMTLIVIPFSMLRYRPQPSITNIWLSLAIHVLAFGLPIALIARAMLGDPEEQAIRRATA